MSASTAPAALSIPATSPAESLVPNISLSTDEPIIAKSTRKRRLHRFRPKLKLEKQEPDISEGAESSRTDTQNATINKSLDETYVHKISDSGNFIISSSKTPGQKIKVGDAGIKVEQHANRVAKSVPTPSAASDPNFDPMQNVSLEDFKIVKKLGSGAQGSVEKVRNKMTKQIFARKTFRMHSSINASPKMLITEFRALYTCDCKNIIRLYHAFHKEGTMYMILELMNCGSLEDVLRTVGPIPEQILSKMCVQMLNGLDYLHTQMRTVHRDVKPANILLNDKGVVKIADFGMSGHYRNRDVFTTYQGSALYMSPERMSGSSHTYNSDVWSLGVTLAEAALGRPLFKPEEVPFLNFKDKDKVSLKDLEGFSVEFQDFIASCLMVIPEKRPSAEQLLHSPFITKYYQTKPSLKHWIRKTYVPLRKQQKKESTRRKAA